MGSSATVRPAIEEMQLVALGTSQTGPLFKFMVSLDAKVETQAKRNASGPIVGVRTGNLRSSGHSAIDVRGRTLVGQVIFDASYALTVHEGAAAHDIVPVRAKVLAWQAAGGPRFAYKVHQPARRGRPFLTEALRTVIH